MESVSFNIPSLSCSACSKKIQEGIKALKGIGNISVDLKTQQVNIQYNPTDIQADEIKRQLIAMGYDVIQ